MINPFRILLIGPLWLVANSFFASLEMTYYHANCKTTDGRDKCCAVINQRKATLDLYCVTLGKTRNAPYITEGLSNAMVYR